MSEIKACPFCGGTKICTEKSINLNYCDNCSAESNVEQWNTRPIEDALNARIAELEAEIDQLTAHDATERQNDKCSKPEPNVCEACGGDGTVLLTDGYKGQVIATAKCIYCNGTGRVNKEREE
jgi:hypothetical protein